MKRILLFLLFLGLAGPPVWAAGTCTVSDVTSSQNASSRVPDASTVIVTLTCIGDASTGSFPSTTVPISGSSPSGSVLNAYNLTGYFLYQVKRTPGTTAPTANYTVTVKDTDLFALDLGLLTSNGSASASQLTAITNGSNGPPIVQSALTVAITGNSVASANIRIDLIFRATSSLASLGTASTGSGGGSQVSFTTPIVGPGFYPQSLTSGPYTSFFDDFIKYAGVTAGNIGSPTGASCASSITSLDVNHPGMFDATSGTAGGATGTACFLGSISGDITSLNTTPGWTWESEVIPSVLPATTATGYQAGIAHTVNAAIWTDGIGFLLSYASSVGTGNSFGSGNAPASFNDWVCEYGNQYADTGVLATLAWTRLTITSDGTTTKWYINGTQVCSVASSSLPSTSRALDWTVAANTVTSEKLTVDYVLFQRAATR